MSDVAVTQRDDCLCLSIGSSCPETILEKTSFIYLDKSVIQIHFYRDKNVPGLFLMAYLYFEYRQTQKYKP